MTCTVPVRLNWTCTVPVRLNWNEKAKNRMFKPAIKYCV